MGGDSRLNHTGEFMGEQRGKKQSEEEVLAEAEKTLGLVQKASGEKVEKTDKSDKKSDKVEKAPRVGKPKQRSKKYQEAVTKVDKTKFYDLAEAIETAKLASYSKFDGSIELHVSLLTKRGEDRFRAMIDLPHGTGKKVNAVILTDELIAKIAKTKKVDADILLAKPDMMAKIAKIAKILGPIGKMPNPKSGTITADPEKAIKEFNAGKIEVRSDANGNIHQLIGKVSWDSAKLKANIEALIAILPKSKLQRVVVCATMSPAVKVKI